MTLEELNQHLLLREQLNQENEILAALLSAAQPGAARLTGMPHAPGVNDKVGDLAAEIADVSTHIDEIKAVLASQEPEILAFITGIPDIQVRTILRLRFIRALSWKEVSQVLGRYTSEASVRSACYRFFRSASESDNDRSEKSTV